MCWTIQLASPVPIPARCPSLQDQRFQAWPASYSAFPLITGYLALTFLPEKHFATIGGSEQSAPPKTTTCRRLFPWRGCIFVFVVLATRQLTWSIEGNLRISCHEDPIVVFRMAAKSPS